MKIFFCLLTGVFLLASAHAQKQQITFVCEHGSLKSVIAAKCFNDLAREKKLNWEAVARGVIVDDGLSPRTKEWLIRENLFDSTTTPIRISQRDVTQSQSIYLFNPLPADVKGDKKTVNWQDIQMANGDYIQLKKDIMSRMRLLIDSLKNKQTKP